jgi:hypothetical protein
MLAAFPHAVELVMAIEKMPGVPTRTLAQPWDSNRWVRIEYRSSAPT